jgi:hypothetical protein
MRHLIRHWWKFIDFVFLVVLVAACQPKYVNTPVSTEDQLRLAHKRACSAKGEVQISLGKSLGEDCTQRTARLNELVKTDQDCKAYFGSKPVEVSSVCD